MSTRRVLVVPGPVVTDSAIAGVRIVPTVYTEELWAGPTLADVTSSADLAPAEVGFPGAGRMVARMLEFSRASTDEVAAEQAAVDELMSGSGATRGDLHRTRTIDFFVIVSGIVHLECETGAVELSAGDVAVCLGALHGWRTRTIEPAQVFAVLAGAQDYGDTASADFSPAPVAGSGPGARRVVLGHDAAGTATLLDDRIVPLPARLWATLGTVPSNLPGRDPLVAMAAHCALQPHDITFDLLTFAEEGLHLDAADHQVVGVVLAGRPVLGPARSWLDPGDTFVTSGVGVDLAADGPAQVAVVALPGWRSPRG